jgi:hypothetical protein
MQIAVGDSPRTAAEASHGVGEEGTPARVRGAYFTPAAADYTTG